MGMPRRTHRFKELLAATICVTFALSGCAAVSPHAPKPTVTSGSVEFAPYFASDDDALRAAKDAYTDYEKVANAIVRSGGKKPERLAPYVTADALAKQIKGFRALSDNKVTAVGNSSFDSVKLEWWQSTMEKTYVTISLCEDISNVRVIDVNGKDVTPVDRLDYLPQELTFVPAGSGDSLVLDEAEDASSKFTCKA